MLNSDTLNYNLFANGEVKSGIDNSGRLQNNIALFEKAVELAPAEPTFLLNLGWLYIFNSDIDSAISVFERTITLSPGSYQAQSSLGLCLEFQNKKDSAGYHYTQAIILSPFILESAFFEDLRARNSDLANIVVQKAIQSIDNGSSNIIDKSKLSKLYFESGKINEAKMISYEITRMLPNLNRTWVTLGDVHMLENDYNEAEKCYKKAAVLDSRDKLPMVRLYYLNKSKNEDKQMLYYKRAYSKIKASSENTNYFKTLYGCNSIIPEAFPYRRDEYFYPKFE